MTDIFTEALRTATRDAGVQRRGHSHEHEGSGHHADHDHGTHSVALEAGDLVFFEHLVAGAETQSAGIVLELHDGLLTIARPHGFEVLNMRASTFIRVWRVEHAPATSMTGDEAYAFAIDRLAQLRRRPLVVVHPEDERAALGR